ncbi:hypothetical protein [Microbacterium sp.]|uniref:hypothetical protein n=1 Tax=Microbacterium sp. TaxID=51671 RepID=UPI0025E9ED16|nr:hypothetical protein [Microbacterium sp.]
MTGGVWALDLACRIAAVGVLVGALEQWHIRERFAAGGVLGPPPAARSDVRSRMLLLLVAAQVIAALIVITVGVASPPGWVALCLLVIAFTSLRVLRRVGGDGAEQMASIVLIATALVAPAFPGDVRVALAVAFIAAQAVLAYLTSGVAKFVSPVWRDGTGLRGILSTVDHGTPAIGRWLGRHPGLSVAASWATIGFECGFVLALVLPPPLAGAVLGVGLAFHAACAALMGLNSFLWAFPATYPCVWVANEAVRGVLFG